MKYLVSIISCIIVLKCNVLGQLDNTFNGNGKQYISVNNTDIEMYHLARQQDGKLLLAGRVDDSLLLTRLNQSGSIDNSFGENGFFSKNLIATYENIESLVVLSDGSLILFCNFFISSESKTAIVKLDNNGNIINSFGLDGVILLENISSPTHSFLLSDNNIILVTYLGIYKINQNGEYVSEFGINGKLELLNYEYTVNDLSIQSNGCILLAGQLNGNSVILRINSNGTMDNSFGSNGIKTINVNNDPDDRATSVIQISNGNILVGGYYFNHIYLMQLNSTNGDLVTTYGTEGIVAYSYPNATNSIANAIAEDPISNDILIAGTALYGAKSYFALSRVSSTGTVEAYAAIDMGGDLAEAKSLVIQPDRKIVIAGSALIDNTYQMAVARLVPDFTTLIQGIESPETIIGNINLFPNPASHYVNIHSQYRLEYVKVLDAIGNEIMQENLNGNTKLDISRLSKGLFHFIIQTEQGTVTKKVSVW